MTSEPAQIAAVRRAVESVCSDSGLDDRAACEVGLCVNEALANVIRHAYGNRPGQPIQVSAAYDDRDGGAVEVRIRDWGNGVNPATLPAKKYDPLEPGGLGLICLYRCMSEVRFESQPDGGMLLVLRKQRRPMTDENTKRTHRDPTECVSHDPGRNGGQMCCQQQPQQTPERSGQ